MSEIEEINMFIDKQSPLLRIPIPVGVPPLSYCITGWLVDADRSSITSLGPWEYVLVKILSPVQYDPPSRPETAIVLSECKPVLDELVNDPYVIEYVNQRATELLLGVQHGNV